MRKTSGRRNAVAYYLLPFLLLLVLAGYSACLSMRVNQLSRQADGAVVDWYSLFSATDDLFEPAATGAEAEQSWNQRVADLDASLESLQGISRSWMFQRSARNQVQMINDEWLAIRGGLEASLQRYHQLLAATVGEGPAATSLEDLIATTQGQEPEEILWQAKLAEFDELRHSMSGLVAANSEFADSLRHFALAVSNDASQIQRAILTITVILAMLILGIAYQLALRSERALHEKNTELDALNEELNVANEELVSVNEQLEAQYQELSATADRLLVTERTLRASEEQYRNLYETAQVGLFRTRISDGLVTKANEAASKLWGFSSAEDVIAAGFSATNFYTDPSRRQELIEQLRQSGSISDFDIRLKLPDGRERDFSMSARIFPEEDYIEGAIVDITLRKQIERDLQASEERHRAVFENANDAVLVYKDDCVIDCNPQALTMFSSTRAEILGRTPAARSPEYQPDGSRSEELVQVKMDLAADGLPQRFEWKHRRDDGTLFDSDVSLSRMELGTETLLLAVVRDIAEQKKTEAELRAGQVTLRSILRAAPTGIGMVVDRVIVQANERLCEMTGYTSDELIGKSSRLLYPDQEEFDWVGKEKYRQISAEGAGTVETVFLCKDGRMIDILLSSSPIDSGDLSKGVTFTALDITKRKQAEQALRENEEKFRTLSEQSLLGIMIFQDNRVKYFSNAICALVEYSAEEITAWQDEEYVKIIHPEDRAFVLGQAHLKQAGITDGVVTNYRFRMITKSGREKWIELFSRTVTYDGKPADLLMMIDVSERLHAEKALRYSEESNRAIVESSPLGISVRDKTGRLLRHNEAWCRIWAMPDEAIQQDLTRQRAELSFDDLDSYLGDWQESVWNVYKRGGTLHVPKVQSKSSRPGAAEWVAQYYYAIQDDQGQVDRVVILTEDITQRVQIEEELQHHRNNLEQLIQERTVEVELFKSFVETSGEGMGWSDLAGNIKYANSALCAMLEVEDGDRLLTSQTIDYYPAEYLQDLEKSILPKVLASGMWSGDLPMITAKNNLLSTRQNIFTLQDHDGKPILFANVITDLTLRMENEDSIKRLNVELTAANQELTSLNEDFLLINQELTATNDMLVSSREALVESEERLKAILDNSTAVIYLKGASGRYLLVNRTFEVLFNLSQQDCVGKFASDIFPRDVADAMSENERQVLSTEQPMQFEETVPHQDGNHTYISIKFPLRDANGDIYSVCSLSTDITELAMTRYQAEEASRAKSQFLAKMSHELRTPLSAINGFASILLEQHCGPLNEQQVQYVKWMLSSGDHLLGIINDLLDLAKIEAGKMAIMKTPLDLGQLSRETYDMFAESLDDHQVQLALEIPTEMVLVNGDPTRLKQVLLNLLSNAVKFTAEGQITVYLQQTGGQVRWGVKDTGIGIHSEDLAKLFKPFEQVSEDLSAKRSGTGLGLALSREIILAHGGDISVESEAGRGSDFFVIFELEKV